MVVCMLGSWKSVTTNPLELVGIVLSGVLTLVAKLKPVERRWALPAAVLLAAAVVVGAFFLAYRETKPSVASEPAKPSAPAKQQSNTANQVTSGPGSPAVQGVQGDVSITVDQTGTARPTAASPRSQPKSGTKSGTAGEKSHE